MGMLKRWNNHFISLASSITRKAMPANGHQCLQCSRPNNSCCLKGQRFKGVAIGKTGGFDDLADFSTVDSLQTRSETKRCLCKWRPRPVHPSEREMCHPDWPFAITSVMTRGLEDRWNPCSLQSVFELAVAWKAARTQFAWQRVMPCGPGSQKRGRPESVGSKYTSECNTEHLHRPPPLTLLRWGRGDSL